MGRHTDSPVSGGSYTTTPAKELGVKDHEHKWVGDGGVTICSICDAELSEDNCGSMFDMSGCVKNLFAIGPDEAAWNRRED